MKYFAALKSYYAALRLRLRYEDLRARHRGTPLAQRRTGRAVRSWLSSKRGDEDVAPPDPRLAAELGLPAKQGAKGGPLTAFARVGKFFWQQMTRIR